MRPSKAPGVWGTNRWLEQFYQHSQEGPQKPILDFPDQTRPDLAYDDGDRAFWEKVIKISCELATKTIRTITPSERNLDYKPLDREAVRQIDNWRTDVLALNDRRSYTNYCRRHHWSAQGILDKMTGDEDVLIAGLNPRPTEEDLLDDLAIGYCSSSPAHVEAIRSSSQGYSTLGFALWKGDTVIGMIAGNHTRQNYGRDHMAFGLIQKAPSWTEDTAWATKAIGLPGLFAAHLVGRTQIILEGADDPPGFHRLMQRLGFKFAIRSRPEGYGRSGTLVANIQDLATQHGIPLPDPFVVQVPQYRHGEVILSP